MSDPRLRRLQWAVRATLTLGVAASVTANILHARPDPISQAIAAWPPLALLITVELVSRIPVMDTPSPSVHNGLLALPGPTTKTSKTAREELRIIAARHGETGTVPYLLPLSVDGLIVVASVSLVELAGRRRDTASGRDPALAETPTQTAAVPAVALAELALAGPVERVTVASRAGEAAFSAAARPALAHGAAGGPGIHDLRSDRTSAPDDERNDDEPHDGLNDIDADTDLDEDKAGHDLCFEDGTDVAPDLVPLLPAARAARDELTREGRTVSRDALARRMRRNFTEPRTSSMYSVVVRLG